MRQRTFHFMATARPTHPITSHRAADVMNTGDNLTDAEEYAMSNIRRFSGHTAKQIERLAGDIDGRTHRRIAGLVVKGKVKQEYPAGCRAAIIRLKE